MTKYTLSDIFQGDFSITQRFAENPSYYGQFTIYGMKMLGHEGVDWGTPEGTKIVAPFDGVILRQDFQPDFTNYGKVVVLWSPSQRCAVWYAHLSVENVSNGQSVKKGDVLGETGNTGNSSGPHLHFGVVETDGNGNRLHAFDGFGGFIDPLGAQITWNMGSTAPVVASDGEKYQKIIKQVESPAYSDTGFRNLARRVRDNQA